MTDDRDEFNRAPYGGIFGPLAEPVVEPWNDPRLTTYAERSVVPLSPLTLSWLSLFSPSPPVSTWDPSSSASPHIGANSGFPSSPAQLAGAPWSDLRSPHPFAPPATFSPAPPPEQLNSGKYWPVGPGPSGANEHTPARSFSFPPVPQVPTWGQGPTYPNDSGAPGLPHAPRPAGIAVPSIEYLDSAKHWAALPPLAANALRPEHGFYPSPLPQAPSWNSVPTNSADLLPQVSAEPPSRSPVGPDARNLDGGGTTSRFDRTEIVPEVLSDVTPDNYWIPGADYAADGHHEFPREHYRKMPAETRKVFDEAKTGRLFVHSVNGRRHEFDEFHRQYNKATGELLKGFMEANNIANRPDLMTPDHARTVLKTIAGSEDLRIRTYAEFIKRLRLFYRLRGGDQ